MNQTAAGANPIRVLMADDHAVVLWGLRQLIESARPGMCVSGTASSGAELMGHPALGITDVVLLDLGLPDVNAMDCVRQLASAGVKTLVLTGSVNVAQHREAVLQGARGVVLKSHPTDRLLKAIERVHAGEVWLDGTLMAQLLGTLPGVSMHTPGRDPHAARIASLTPKERQVVVAVVHHRGAKSLVVADALGMSEHTLRNHLTVIYSKLGVHGRLDLYAFALEHGLAPQAPAPVAALPVLDLRAA